MNIGNDLVESYTIKTDSIPKLVLDFHTREISTLQFSKVYPEILYSGSYDQFITLWNIDQSSFSAKKLKVIKLKSEITQIALYPDDSYLFACCFDSNIYMFKINYNENTYENCKIVSFHDNIVNSICLDPNIINTGNFYSLSNNGRLILAKYNKDNNSITIGNDYAEFMNENNHRCNVHLKKIDWSVDRKWIISVDHHQIKKQNIIHCRLINFENNQNNQILIGQESPVYVAKFSKCLYIEKKINNNLNNNEQFFQLCATADKNGSIIIWKIVDNKFSVFIEVNNYSESNITDLYWSNDGKYLFSVNSTGSFCAIQLTELDTKLFNREYNYNNNDSNNLNNSNNNNNCQKRKHIIPTLISSSQNNNNFNNNNNNNNYQIVADSNNNCLLNNDNSNNNYINNNNFINGMEEEFEFYNNNYKSLNCQRCKKQLYKVIENKKIEREIPNLFTKDMQKVVISYENNPFHNYSIITMKCKDKILYSNKYLNRMIKIFTANNYFYGFYDTNFTLNCYTLLNSLLFSNIYFEEISFIENYGNYLLIFTSQNKLIILNVFNQEKIIDEFLNLNNIPNCIFQTKIDTIYFLNLKQVLIKAESFNPYQNINNKSIFYFYIDNKILIKSSFNDLTEEDKKLINLNKNNSYTLISFYNNFFKDNIDSTRQFFLNENDYFIFSENVINFYEDIYKNIYIKNFDKVKELVQKLFIFIHSKYFEDFHFVIDDCIYIFSNFYPFIKKDIINIRDNILRQNQSLFVSNNNNSNNKPYFFNTNSNNK